MGADWILPASARWRKPWIILCSLVLSGCLAGCIQLNDPETTQVDQSQVIGSASREITFGQTLHSRQPSPANLQIYLKAESSHPQDALAIVELFSRPGDKQPLAVFNYPLQALNSNIAVSVPLEKIQETPDRNYYLTIRTTAGSVQVLGRNEDAYSAGTAYQDGNPISADLAFRLSYDYRFTDFFHDFWEWLRNSWLIIPLVTFLWLPGRLLLALLGLFKERDWGEKVALSVGLSLALTPLVLLWSSTLGLHWSRTGLYLVTLALWGFYFTQQYQSWRKRKSSPKIIPNRQALGYSLGLLVVFLVSLAVRLITVRDLATPPWVDSIHHATIMRLIIENGAFPANYLPLIDIGNASYHPGYHAGLAAFVSLARIELARGMLIYGQVLNALIIFAAYLFTKVLVKNRLAALLAALFAGLFSPMPAYYTSWGRYTQLAGLLILPAAFALTVALLQSLSGSRRLLHLWKPTRESHVTVRYTLTILSVAAVAAGGLLLVHFRVLIFFMCLVSAWLIVNSLARRRQPGAKNTMIIQMAILCAEAAAAIIITLPWFPALLNSIEATTQRGTSTPVPWFYDFSWTYLNNGLGIYLLVLSVVGLIWGIFQRRRFSPILLLWIILLYAIANIGVMLPALNANINNTSVTITLFFPITSLMGYLIAWVYTGWRNLVRKERRWIVQTGFAILILVTSVIASRTLVTILNPVTILTRQADLVAINWIETNLPEDAVIAVNPFLWGYGVYAGSDGGFWISPVAGRRTVPPPVLSGIDYRSQASLETSRLSEQILEASRDPAKLSQTLLDAGVGYIFLGGKPGAFSSEILSASPYFQEIFQKNGVRIYKVVSDERKD